MASFAGYIKLVAASFCGYSAVSECKYRLESMSSLVIKCLVYRGLQAKFIVASFSGYSAVLKWMHCNSLSLVLFSITIIQEIHHYSGADQC